MICRRCGVRLLQVFGSVARATDFDPERSDADFPGDFGPDSGLPPLQQFFGFAEEPQSLLGRSVDLSERSAFQASRNYICRRRILAEAQPIYG